MKPPISHGLSDVFDTERPHQGSGGEGRIDRSSSGKVGNFRGNSQNPGRIAAWLPALAAGLAALAPILAAAAPAVVLNEIHYHPVELSAFDTNGAPLLDLSSDVHEFLEIHNPGNTNVSLAGWRLSGDVEFAFPTNAAIGGGRYLVIARNPARLLAVSQYNLTAATVLGPYQGNLGNRGGTVRLRDPLDNTVDAVSYSSQFPWAIGADALGADDEWTGLNSSNFQYRGRSLERVSAAWAPNDPANWVASPAPGNPSPGRANAGVRATPRPVVTAISAVQTSTGSPIIRANQAVRIDCSFSGVTSLSGVVVEHFVDDINLTTETRTTTTMTVVGNAADGNFTVQLPGRPDRSVVRYRIRANRGGGVETVSPRADDPFAYHAYFVTPVRASTNRIYDCFISQTSLNTLATNLNPAVPSGVDTSVQRRIILPDPPGVPSPYWNATQPAVLVADGVVYDARARYHGSQYRRTPANNSWKWQFPRYQKLDDRSGIFISDNDDVTVACGQLYRLAGVPQSYTRWVDFYLNTTAGTRRMDQDEMDDDLVTRFLAEQRALSPELPKEESGEFYKSQGNFLFTDPTGPFGYGGYRMLPARPPYWTQIQRYEHTYGMQMNGWKGHRPFMEMLHGLWAARGDAPLAPNPNIPALRSFLSTNFDVDTTLASMAIRVWTGGWDNFNHNHFTWRRENGKWVILQWDFDGELDTNTVNLPIYLSEQGVALAYPAFAGPPAWVDANWLNDSFFKAFREEYKQKLFVLNNTLLNPTNISAIGLGSYRGYANGRFASVNQQLALGTFLRPRTPGNVFPGRLDAALDPAALISSAYSHTASPAPAHRSTTWWIRSTNGGYNAPVFKTTSTSNLTSIPIPFDKLTFGQTYFWKCVHTDADGHPSLESSETPFIYGAEPSFERVIAIDENSIWRFNTNGLSLPTTWRTVDFDDSLWAEGAALIGDDTEPLVEPLRTPIFRGSRLVTYFRKKFVFNGDPTNVLMRLRHVVDDGVVVWLNGAEVHRIGLAGGPGTGVGNATPSNRGVTDAAYEGPFVIAPTNLINGVNVIAASVHRQSNSSPDVVFGMTVDVAAPLRPGSVVISEVLADNRSAVTNGSSQPDYVELLNTTDRVQNLDGLSLSDNVRRPGKYIFPPNTSIPAGGRLVVWCDSDTNAPGLHTGFALDNDGQTLALFSIRANGYFLADSVTFGLQIPDLAVSRGGDGTGPWAIGQPTPGGSHIPATLGPPSSLKINEWMATDAGGPDWIEIYNASSLPVMLSGLGVTDDRAVPAKSVLPPLSFIAPFGHRQLIADENPDASARHVNFKLSSGGESIALYDANRNVIDAVDFGPQFSGVSEGRLPDGANGFVFFDSTASPEEPNYLPIESVLISELLAHSDPPLEDAIELYNPSDVAVNIGNWWLSDERSRPQKYQLPPGTTVPQRGYLVVYENQFNANPGTPGSFALSSARGDEVYLSQGSGDGSLTGYRSGAKFGPSESGVSIGRFETSQGTVFVALSRPTFGIDSPGTVEQFRTGTGAANAGAKVGPVVISEIQYRPPNLAGEDNARDEFVELRNLTAGSVPLFLPGSPSEAWRLRDAVSYVFPPGVTLAPNETVLVVGFDPVADTNALAGFRDTYGPSSARLFGPWSGKLDNSRDSVELAKPDAPVTEPGPDLGYVPFVLVDKVEYSDGFPWPDTADGTGFSLMRTNLSGYGNDPVHWTAWYPTPGRDNVLNQAPTLTVTSPTNGAVFPFGASVFIAATASDPDGSIAWVDFLDGATRLARVTQPPYEFTWANPGFGPRTLTISARDNRFTVTSRTVDIRVESQPPTVALSSPSTGALFANRDVVTLTAVAADSDTPIAKVEFFVDDIKVGEDSAAPYGATWVVTPGAHYVTAVATDTSGATGTSAAADVFGQVTGTIDSMVVARGSEWRYYDGGGNPGATWAMPNFDDAGWLTGRSELGFGDGDEITTIRQTIGGVPSIAFYFRQTFNVSSVADASAVQLNLLRDDGAVVYLNGVEVARQNMPTGPVTFQTLAAAAVSVPEEATFFPVTLSPTNLVEGQNVLAVEVHQSGTTSSDVSFNADLLVRRATFGPGITAHPQNQVAAPGGSVTFTVSATGLAPLAYQWLYNGQPLAQQTGASLTLANLRLDQAGLYSVTISNSIAVVTSRPATLTVADIGADSDGDGLPDEWELQYGLNRFDGSDRDLDPDSDRMSNWAEFVAGTNPKNASSVLRFSAITHGPGSILTFNAAANMPYAVEYKDTLGAQPWLTLTTVPARTTNRTATVIDPTFGNSRFFRLSTPQAPATPSRILSLTAGSATTLTFNAVSNRTYLIQFNDAGGWRSLDQVGPRPTNHTAVVYDPAATPSRIYRLLIPSGN